MLIKRASDIRSSEITDKESYLNRRDFIRGAAGTVAAAAAGFVGGEQVHAQAAPHKQKLANVVKSPLSITEAPNPWEHITAYNNFYEFGLDKTDPARNAGKFQTQPWTVAVEGECNKPAAWHLEDILKGETLEERIYRHRCVEGWSMIIPWVGFPLSDFIKRCEPTSKAKFVEFTTILDPKQMPGQKIKGFGGLEWPYVEGLRMDEAMHPLTILVVGLYGEILPNQNGAPLRLHVPWKYGFKSGKSIVKIRFVEKQPFTTWQKSAPNEYGFYANVNPKVSHPRWSQASEQAIGKGFFRKKTILFNGYGDQVASMYNGMDLKKNF